MSGRREDIKAGSAFIELTVKDEKLKRGLLSAKDSLSNFGKAAIIGHYLLDIAKEIIDPIREAIRGFAEYGESITKMSERTGVAVEMLQKLDYVARQSGTSLDDVEKALKHFESNGHSPRQFLELLENLAKIDSSGLRAKRAIELFGKRGTALLPMIEQLHTLGDEFDRLELSGAQIRAADELATSFTRMRKAMKAVRDQLAAAIAPAVQQTVEWFTTLAKVVAGLARDFPMVAKAIAIVTVAVLGLGAAFVALAGVGTILSGVLAVLDLLAAPWIVMAAAIAVIVADIILLETELAVVVYWFATSTRVGQQFLEAVMRPLRLAMEHFRTSTDAATKTIRGLLDALKTGDVASAWKILTLGMSASFHEFAASVLRDISEVLVGMQAIASSMMMFGRASLAGAGATKAREAAAGFKAAAEAEQAMIDALQKKNDTKNKHKPNSTYVPLGEQSAAAIGFSARAALMGRNVIGLGRDEKLSDTMTKLLIAGEASNKNLEEIKKKIGAKFLP